LGTLDHERSKERNDCGMRHILYFYPFIVRNESQ
jgi:hypothetical protein